MLDLSSARNAPVLVPSPVSRPLGPASRYVLRGKPQVMRSAGEALGLELSTVACRSVRQGSLAALWLGPDEQLVLCCVEDGPSILGKLQQSLTGLPHCLVDVSHRQIALEVTGPYAQSVLSVGCPLDLHPASFPVGMCTRTLLGKADIVLWRTSADTFHIEVWRSFADYATRFLAAAARELAA